MARHLQLAQGLQKNGVSRLGSPAPRLSRLRRRCRVGGLNRRCRTARPQSPHQRRPGSAAPPMMLARVEFPLLTASLPAAAEDPRRPPVVRPAQSRYLPRVLVDVHRDRGGGVAHQLRHVQGVHTGLEAKGGERVAQTVQGPWGAGPRHAPGVGTPPIRCSASSGRRSGSGRRGRGPRRPPRPADVPRPAGPCVGAASPPLQCPAGSSAETRPFSAPSLRSSPRTARGSGAPAGVRRRGRHLASASRPAARPCASSGRGGEQVQGGEAVALHPLQKRPDLLGGPRLVIRPAVDPRDLCRLLRGSSRGVAARPRRPAPCETSCGCSGTVCRGERSTPRSALLCRTAYIAVRSAGRSCCRGMPPRRSETQCASGPGTDAPWLGRARDERPVEPLLQEPGDRRPTIGADPSSTGLLLSCLQGFTCLTPRGEPTEA